MLSDNIVSPLKLNPNKEQYFSEQISETARLDQREQFCPNRQFGNTN